jgi:hypothetical protein
MGKSDHSESVTSIFPNALWCKRRILFLAESRLIFLNSPPCISTCNRWVHLRVRMLVAPSP